MRGYAGGPTSLTELHVLVRRLPKLKLERQRLQVVAGFFVPDLRDYLRNCPEVLRNDNKKEIKARVGGTLRIMHVGAKPRQLQQYDMI